MPLALPAHHHPHLILSADVRLGLSKQRPPLLRPTLLQLIVQKIPPSRLGSAGRSGLVTIVPLVRIPSANPPRLFSLSPTSALTSTTMDLLHSLPMPASMSFPLASFGRGGVIPGRARDMALSMLAMRTNKRRLSTPSRARKSAAVPSLSRLPSTLLVKIVLTGTEPTSRPPMRLSSTKLKLHQIQRQFPRFLFLCSLSITSLLPQLWSLSGCV